MDRLWGPVCWLSWVEFGMYVGASVCSLDILGECMVYCDRSSIVK